MRASRLVNLLLLLQSRGGMTAAELARELEVSVRTVHRDVEELSAAGVPIFAERGPLGGIRLVDGYRTRLTGMTADEAEALFLAGLPGPAAQLGLGTVVAAAQLKVMAALPPELRSRASRIVERFHLDAAGWFHADDDRARTSPRCRRRSGMAEPCGSATNAAAVPRPGRADGRAARARAEGRHLVRDRGHGRADPDVPSVKRVLDATLLDERVERPPGFDLAAYWQESSAAYERDVPTVEVTVRVPMDREWRIADVFGREALETAERLDEPDPDGWSRLRLTLSWPEEVAGQAAIDRLRPGGPGPARDPGRGRERPRIGSSNATATPSRSRPAAEPSGSSRTSAGATR